MNKFQFLIFAGAFSTLYANCSLEVKERDKKMNEDLKPFSEKAQQFTAGSIYEHYKGMRYKILAVARHSETLEEMVVYQALYGNYDVWVRPLDMFLETIEIDGKIQPRFTLIA
jgi:hypothetical protein